MISHTISVLSARIDVVSLLGGGGSVTSAEASAISAQAASAIDVVSNAVSVLSQAVSVVSQQVSANSNSLANLSVRTSLAGASVKGLQSVLNAISQRISVEAPLGGDGGSVNAVGYVSVEQSISATTLITVSGLCVSISAGAVYKIEGRILNDQLAAADIRKFALNFPALTRGSGYWFGAVSASPAASAFESATVSRGAWWNGGDSGVTAFSATGGATDETRPTFLEGMMHASTTGTVHVLCNTAAGDIITILRGSYLRLVKIV